MVIFSGVRPQLFRVGLGLGLGVLDAEDVGDALVRGISLPSMQCA
jgi:hypothetical protein